MLWAWTKSVRELGSFTLFKSRSVGFVAADCNPLVSPVPSKQEVSSSTLAVKHISNKPVFVCSDVIYDKGIQTLNYVQLQI